MSRRPCGMLRYCLALAAATSLTALACTDVEFDPADAGNGAGPDATAEDTNSTADVTDPDSTGGPDSSCSESEQKTYYRDSDGDGFGVSEDAGSDGGRPATRQACSAPDGYAAETGDCNDDDDTIHPDADETCDETDSNCDGEPVAGADGAVTFYRDRDEDGYGDEETPIHTCDEQTIDDANVVDEGGDCDDYDDTIHPETPEVCDGVDNDCDADTPTGSNDDPADETHGGDSIAAAGHTCAVSDGELRCWGPNGKGQLGYGDQTARHSVPTETVDFEDAVKGVAVGSKFTCAYTVRRPYCWGSNMHGALGVDPDLPATNSPEQLADNLLIDDLAVGNNHGCLLGAKGYAHCWGYNNFGQAGADPQNNGIVYSPSEIALTDGQDQLRFEKMALGSHHSCGLTSNHDVYCWGFNKMGQLGLGDEQDRWRPTRVEGEYTDIAAGGPTTCALRDGEAYCWGLNSDGKLGDGTTDSKSSPTPVKTQKHFTDITVGETHVCGITAENGQAFCWGRNLYGETGGGDDQSKKVTSPTPVDTDLRFKELTAGQHHTCGLTTDDQVVCWGQKLPLGIESSSSEDKQTTPIPTVCEASE